MQRQCNLVVISDLAVYNPRASYEETMRGRGGNVGVAHYVISGDREGDQWRWGTR
jgi:hypothetical protein